MIHGVDISKFQGNVDFHALKDNADFVIIRSTYGVGYTDDKFVRNRDTARSVDLGIGFYHYAYPQFNSPLAEADWFTMKVSCQPGELLCLDFEEHYPDPVNWCKTFLDRCVSNMGFKPLLYINYALVKAYDWTPVINGGYGLWLAYWNYNPDTNIPTDTGWNIVAMRQYSNKGNVAGMNPVDLDVFYGDLTAFKKYGNPPPETTTTTILPPVTSSSTSETTTTTATTTTILSPTIPPKPSFFTQLIRWFLGLFRVRKS
jgi:lysozyme